MMHRGVAGARSTVCIPRGWCTRERSHTVMDRETRPWRSELTPVAFLERSTSVFRERTAVIDGTRRYSYAELGERVLRLMGALRVVGVQTNHRVAVLCGNVPAMIEAHFAVPAIGAILVP